MKIVIAGGTGFLGRPLAQALAGDGHDIVILTRQPPRGGEPLRTVRWTPDGTAGAWAAEIDGADAVVNLAGESIAERWTASQKRRILDSRVLATRSLAQAIASAHARAVGVRERIRCRLLRAARQTRCVTEEHPPGSDFLARVCEQWEAEAVRASRPALASFSSGRPGAREGRRRAAEDVPPFCVRRRADRIGPSVSGHGFIATDWIALVRWTIARPHATGRLQRHGADARDERRFARAIGRACTGRRSCRRRRLR